MCPQQRASADQSAQGSRAPVQASRPRMNNKTKNKEMYSTGTGPSALQAHADHAARLNYNLLHFLDILRKLIDRKQVSLHACDDKVKEEMERPNNIPDFCLTVFRNVDIFCDMILEHDEPILKHLQDLKMKFSDPGQPMRFTLEFHFEPNEYFTNEVITKEYLMESQPGQFEFFYEPAITGCTGQIDWKKRKKKSL
ncbi:nucleosome assembly protein 1-like 1-A [Scyliorhinus torazame]|uniref:nucleosome assembly protein 1-like 1-A n=1 Tax=Scyliorhinus torazame TaxID=75743 RepID=UPI003B5A1A5A